MILTRFESPEISPHIYGQLFFDKSAKTTQWGKHKPFQQMLLGQLDIHMHKNKFRPLPHTIHNS